MVSVSNDLICVYIQEWPAWLSKLAHAQNVSLFQIFTKVSFDVDGKVDGKSKLGPSTLSSLLNKILDRFNSHNFLSTSPTDRKLSRAVGLA